MNWRLVVLLSLLGFVMALASVFIIPFRIEPFFWIIIFLVSGYCIGHYCDESYFLNGLFVGILNSLWVTLIDIALFKHYYPNHRNEVNGMFSMGITSSVRTTMLLIGPATGLVCGFIIGLIALVFSKVGKQKIA